MIVIMCTLIQQVFEGAPLRRLVQGQPLFHTGDAVEFVFLVRSGSVELVRHTPTGARMILHRATDGMILAEASVWSPAYHCDAIAAEPSVLSAIPRGTFRAVLSRDAALASAWAADLARVVQDARLRAEIRTLRTVSERLDAWLWRGRPLPDRGRWQELAQELGVTREALYRELARRRDRAHPIEGRDRGIEDDGAAR